MLFVSLIRWWYGIGWLDQLGLVRARFDRSADFFSIELSLRTLFMPFRQIDADGARKGSLDVMLRAAFDKLFSRLIGALARTVLIVIGSVALAGEAVVGGLRLLLWPLVPLAGLIGIVLMSIGWLPWR